MEQELENVIFPIFRQGLLLRERLRRGDKCDFTLEQGELKGLLRTANEARKWPAYGGDGGPFLGIRYAMTCWLDEVFILDSPWSDRWTERKLEETLYGTNDRAFQFWEQARLAEARSETDALEASYLCVMLGFRGELRDQPAKVRDWCEATEAVLSQQRASAWPGQPPELPAGTNVRPLRARERLRKAVVLLGVGLGVLLFAAAFFVVYSLPNL
jgi:type VI secretion system protein ImpK